MPFVLGLRWYFCLCWG